MRCLQAPHFLYAVIWLPYEGSWREATEGWTEHSNKTDCRFSPFRLASSALPLKGEALVSRCIFGVADSYVLSDIRDSAVASFAHIGLVAVAVAENEISYALVFLTEARGFYKLSAVFAVHDLARTVYPA